MIKLATISKLQLLSTWKNKKHKGVALILVMVTIIVALGIISYTYLNLQSVDRGVDNEIATKGQALNIAQAGLVEALNWFRVFSADRGEFDPIEGEESNDYIIGLVREIVISQRPYLVGRYEIRRQSITIGSPAEDYEIDKRNGVRDVGESRDIASGKRVHFILSRGFIFRPKNPTSYEATKFYVRKTLDNGENVPIIGKYNHDEIKLISQAAMASEIVESNINVPMQAAICYRGSLTVPDKGEAVCYNPGGIGAGYPDTTSPPSISGGGKVDPAAQSSGAYDDSIENVFGLADEQALTIGDDKARYTPTDDPDYPDYNIPEYKFTFMGTPGQTPLPEFRFGEDNPLKGKHAAVYIRGNVIIEQNSNSFFSGLLYVAGDLTINDPSYFSGAVVVTGNCTIQGSSDTATVVYEEGIIDDLQSNLGVYTFYRPPYIVDEKQLDHEFFINDLSAP